MKTMAVNHELRFECPEGFHVMDEEERSKLNFYGEGECECLSDPDRHIIISIGWARLGGLGAALGGAASAAKNMEKKLSKPMQQYGYRLLDMKDAMLDGEAAKGYSYEYETQGIGMAGESYACKRNKTMYYLHVYYRKELQEESLPVWEGIFSSMRWIR